MNNDQEDDDMGNMRGAYYSEPNAGGVAHASSKWDAYQVWLFGKKWECECTGYRTFRRDCKHISLVRDSVRRGSPVVGVVSCWGKL
jgi:hypothetical protein